jgi:hypothetical protein
MIHRSLTISAAAVAAWLLSGLPGLAAPDARPVFEDYLERVLGHDPSPVVTVMSGRQPTAPANAAIVPVVVKTASMQDPASIPIVEADEYSEIDRLALAPRDSKPGSSIFTSAEAREAYAMVDAAASSPPAVALLMMTLAAALAGVGTMRLFTVRRQRLSA